MDKFLHFMGGLIASVIFNAVIDYNGGNAAVFGAMSSSGFGWGKEICYDKRRKEVIAEWNDWTSSTVGAIFGTVIYWSFRLIFPLN